MKLAGSDTGVPSASSRCQRTGTVWPALAVLTLRVLRQVHLGGYVTVSVFEDQRGFPMFNLMGYLVRIDDIAAGALLVLRTQSHADAPVTERASNTLLIPRAEFRRGGESRDAEVPGPLAVEFGRYHVVITGRDVVPDWEALLR